MVEVKVVGFAAGLVFAIAFAGYATYTVGNWTSDAGQQLGLTPLVDSGQSMAGFGESILVGLFVVLVVVAVVVILILSRGG